MKNFVDAKWLNDNLEDVVVIDARYDVHDAEYGDSVYEKDHISGAFYLHIDRDLAGKKGTHGGSRPVPDINDFISKIEEIGIDNSTMVVIYDDSIIAAGRVFWMLKYLGHDKVVILDGGYKSWLNAGYPVTDLVPEKNNKKTFEKNVKKDLCCDMDYVKANKDKDFASLVECRSYERYLGKNEPLYPKAGHIPGAICIDSKSLLDENLKIKDREELENIFKSIKNKRDIIFSCGSGVNAALVFVALDEIGKKGKIYIGGFSDWISYDENPVEIKDGH
ncbi:sulfurtransferase [uncultured Ilyobacter sp.]|uniref:sulfurtransferase n=1 Tax=uncultured Ilyobacter sp. TaxID=544433 RepID=UPI0029F50FB7|nr:sulfurtransferase [uncultured Ilyobacter sp.]